MTAIQFTRNHNDLSTDKGFQFEFFCDRCGNGFMSEFKTSATGIAAGAIRAAGDILGGLFSRASRGSYEIQNAILGPAHDNAFREAIDEIKVNFRQCPKCAGWVCQSTCWNQKRSLCYQCAPDVETELAAAQAQATVEQVKEKVQKIDLTKDIDIEGKAAALCPSCGAHTQGAKFCPECGKALRPKNECSHCGTKIEEGTKFCPECGNKMI